MTNQPENNSFISHVIELRLRLIYSVIAFVAFSLLSYLFVDYIYAFLVKPLANVFEGQNRRLIYTGLADVFFSYIKLSIFTGACVSFPIVAMQIWKFVAPALYKNEKKFFLNILIASPILFLVGGAFVYYVVMPAAWQFFASFETFRLDNNILPIQLEAKVDDYLSLTMSLIFAFGLCFQMPVVLALLAKIGIVSSKSLVNKRRYAIVFIFAVAAVLTPPDILSQLLLGIPLILLYELSILLVKIIEK